MFSESLNEFLIIFNILIKNDSLCYALDEGIESNLWYFVNKEIEGSCKEVFHIEIWNKQAKLKEFFVFEAVDFELHGVDVMD